MKNLKKTKKIGVFDSGFGGLDILRGIVKENKEYDYIYLGDTARSPYGTRSQEIIYKFTVEAINFFFKNNCDLVIIACNTASAEALRTIQEKYLPKYYPNKKVLGVVVPATEEAVLKTRNKRIGVIATSSTVRSEKFIREIKKSDPSIKVFQQACPLLVPIVEEGVKNQEAINLILKDYINPLIKNKIDTLILGCTHYGLLKNKIKKIVGKDVTIISESSVVSKRLKIYLQKHKEIEQKLKKTGTVIFYSTDLTDKFKKLGSIFFGKKIDVKKITIN